MMLKSEHDIAQLIQQDNDMMEILKAVQLLNLPDWWVCAGFVRSKIWDTLHEFQESTPLSDIDVIYFDGMQTDEHLEKELEQELRRISPTYPWSVKNQARMHVINDLPPYKSAEDGIAKFPETATSLGVRLDTQGNVVLTAPHGIQDVINFIVRPTPLFKSTKHLAAVYNQRVKSKNWQSRWQRIVTET
ncbi:nucleotidyltransferase family protein [Salipaludibacillus sp. CF4.18]|uniref:nucleotidyltransferase family protein n=1 Tax=Salipaludibacillus sp. CF4.18 TaxID=3373081 RepID=UPI003EE4586E